MKYFFVAEIKSIQEYIFKTDKLKEIIGGSTLIDNFGKLLDKEGEKPDWLLKVINIEKDEVRKNIELVQTSAGSFKVIIEDKVILKELLKYFEKHVQQDFPNVDLVYAYTAYEGKFSNEIRAEVEEKLKQKRNQIVKPFLSLPSIVQRSSRTGMGITVNDEDYGVVGDKDYEVAKKLEAKKNSVLSKNFRDDLVEDFEEIKNSKSLIAVIHIDGNNVGKIISKVLDNDNYKDELKEFSKELDLATKEATKSAFEKNFHDNSNFRPLILAGDDLTVVCGADYALEFTESFLNFFEAESEKRLSKFLSRVGEKKLTACAGIAYTKYNFPIHYSIDLADELCKLTKNSLKEKAKENGKKTIPSALSFHFVESTYYENIDSVFENELKMKDLSLFFAPYYLDGIPNVNDLTSLITVFKQTNTIKTSFREWLNIYPASETSAVQHLVRSEEVLKEESLKNKVVKKDLETVKDILRNLDMTFQEPFSNGKTPIADAIKLSSLEGDV